MEDEALLKKRLAELWARSSSRSCYTSSDFLSPAGQALVPDMAIKSGQCRLFGGFEAAERRIAFFGNENICGYESAPPIACVKIAPKGAAFADSLTHRDFLGALMSLGVKRETMGDIVVLDNCGYLFCLETIAQYIAENLTKSKHTALICEIVEAFDFTQQAPEQSVVNVASERLDALIAAVYKLSRGAAQSLISAGCVFVDGREKLSGGFVPNAGAMISVRGKGRFSYEGILRETKKGRLQAAVCVY